MGKSTISMVIFNSYVTNYQRVQCLKPVVRKKIYCTLFNAPKLKRLPTGHTLREATMGLGWFWHIFPYLILIYICTYPSTSCFPNKTIRIDSTHTLWHLQMHEVA
jgi:hypothetical protein